MAESKSSKSRRLKSQTVRERADKAVAKPEKPRRLRRTASSVGKPLRAATRVGKKEYYLPMPKNKVGGFLNKRRHFVPSYFRNSWKELRQVTWPNRKETIKLTFAVIVFAVAFATLIGLVDYGLDKIFKRILL